MQNNLSSWFDAHTGPMRWEDLVTGRQIKGLNVLPVVATQKVICSEVSTKVFYGNPMVWYMRLGHISIPHMSALSWTLSSTVVECIKDCTICPLAKKTWLNFPISESITLKPFDLIHLDI